MKQTSKRFVSMGLSVALLLASLLAFFDLIQPTYSELQNKKGTLNSSQDLLANEQDTVSKAKKLISQYETDSKAQSNLALAMPSGPNLAGALAQIYGIATNNQIAIQNIGISTPVIQIPTTAPSAASGATTPLTASQIVKPKGAITFQVTATGNYENLKNFLSQLETNIRIFDLSTFSLQAASPAGAVAGKGTQIVQDFFTYNFSLITYYQLP